jgi:hypothetical protein
VIHRNLSIISSHHPISSPGGGDYRGTYDTGFKRGFMGYRGLLLNDPYKRDRIDGVLVDDVVNNVFLCLWLTCIG